MGFNSHPSRKNSIGARHVSPKPSSAPSWDLNTEYPAVESPALARDLTLAGELCAEIRQLSDLLRPLASRDLVPDDQTRALVASNVPQAMLKYEQALVLLHNVQTYLSCRLSVDATLAPAKALYGQAQSLQAALEEAYSPVQQILKYVDDATLAAVLADPELKAYGYAVRKLRELRDYGLSLSEEDMLIAFGVNGPTAWGNLYDSLAGGIRCRLDLPTGERWVGLAEAASLSQDPSEIVRATAHKAIRQAWQEHEEAAAAILNALSGWRIEEYRRRSSRRAMHFLKTPLHQNRIKPATLDAMMAAVSDKKDLGHRVLRLQAKLLGKKTLAPWDLFAPCPQLSHGGWQPPSFDDAISIIARAYAAIHPDMGAFVHMMAEKRWIEATVGPHKRPGAYCTQFAKSRTPRVYMTYTGGMRELKTLAHELGHAFHNWVMRDMKIAATHYPMTLAETASIFGETVVNAALLEQAKDPADRLQFTWAQAREVESFVLNIPARFHFERRFYEQRQRSTLSPDELRRLMTESWQAWYGDSLSETEPMFWASKLHFSIADLSFYNFPYTFGYLFALGVYAQRPKLGSDFYTRYVALLRDTGSMDAEEVAYKYLGVDLTQPEFWHQSLAIAEQSVLAFEAAATDYLQAKS